MRMRAARPVARRRERAAVGMVGAILIIAAGCAQLAERTVLRVPLNGAPAPLYDAIDDQVLLASVASFVVGTLRLPLSSPVYAYFYGSPDAFEHGLVRDARFDAWVAKDQASFAWGLGTYYGVFLRGDKLAGAPLHVRVGLIAHELTHVSQYELAAGRRSVSEQWLREGWADWVRYRALDHFRLRRYAESREGMIRALRRRGLERLPVLTDLGTSREWNAARAALGQLATYGQAFLAADWLVERRGSAAHVDYFRRFAWVEDRERNFEAAFGVSRDRFAEEFRERLTAWLEPGDSPGRP